MGRSYNKLIKERAKELGFSEIGFSKAEKLTEEEERLKVWLDKGFNAGMAYMNNHFEKRLDPTELVPGAKTVISLMYNYHTELSQNNESIFKVSKYAYGRDYHKVVKNKLKKLFKYINDEIHPVSGRIFVDSAPVLEGAWARKAGLGWIGKNSLLINPKKGSYFFLSELVIDLELDYDSPISDYCGKCTKCIDACPTNAIHPDGYIVDANSCISFLTIENKEEIPEEFKNRMEDYIFGCDICQEVCPWNRFAKEHDEPDFAPKKEFLDMTARDWIELNETKFEKLFFGTPVARTKFEGLKRNIEFVGK